MILDALGKSPMLLPLFSTHEARELDRRQALILTPFSQPTARWLPFSGLSVLCQYLLLSMNDLCYQTLGKS